MKVAILTDYFPPYNGGVAISVFRIAKGLSNLMRNNLIVIAISEYNKEITYPRIVIEDLNGIKVYRLYCTKRIPLNDAEDRRIGYYLLLEVLKQTEINFIHAFYTFSSGYWAYLIKKTQNIPYLLSIRGNDLTKNYFDIRIVSLLSEIMQNSSRILVVNNYIKEFIKTHYPEFLYKTDIIYNSIDEQSFICKIDDEQIRKNYYNSSDFIFSFIGVLKEKKGIQMLIDSFNSISAKYKNAKLMLVGEIYNNLRDEVMDSISKNKNILHFEKVEHDKICKFFFASDVFIISSFDDGLPNSMLEAIATKVPIIASDIFNDVFIDKQNALLFNPFDKEELISCMENLINYPLVGENLAQSAVELLTNKFSVTTEINSFYNTYYNEYKI